MMPPLFPTINASLNLTAAIFLLLGYGAIQRKDTAGHRKYMIMPFIIAAVYHALKGNYTAHVKITRWLYPTWVYVSVTGVIIYVMLYLF